MTEYVNRSELIIGLQNDYDAIFGRKPDFYNGYQIACRFVENFQTADVALVRHGLWMWDIGDVYACTCCGEKSHVKEVMEQPDWGWCPNCGAKMDGGDGV